MKATVMLLLCLVSLEVISGGRSSASSRGYSYGGGSSSSRSSSGSSSSRSLYYGSRGSSSSRSSSGSISSRQSSSGSVSSKGSSGPSITTTARNSWDIGQSWGPPGTGSVSISQMFEDFDDVDVGGGNSSYSSRGSSSLEESWKSLEESWGSGTVSRNSGTSSASIRQSSILGSILNRSDSYQTWLDPLIQSNYEVFTFNVTNPDEVALGAKPILTEIGPFVYRVTTIKNSRDNLKFNNDAETLTYQPRKFYHIDREKSILDPDTTFIIVPNIPLWTGFNKLESGFMKNIQVSVMMKYGLGTPFVTVSVTGLLWGYEDDLPCVGAKLERPPDCPAVEEEYEDDDWGDVYDGWGNDHDLGGDDWKRKKRSVSEGVLSSCPMCTDDWPDNYENMQRLKAEYVNCKCQWGLFKDKNVTLRKPVTMYHGIINPSKMGVVKEFDGEDTMGWWKQGSQCDKIGGQDESIFPPNMYKEGGEMEIFMSQMCRKIKLMNTQNKTVEHAGIETLRFVPNANAFGSHTDDKRQNRNPENECFCMKEKGFTCFKSGVYDMGPCMRTADRPLGAPIALSAPHFYQADPSFREAVIGMHPDKEKHQSYVDVVPELGIPLARQSRFQLNAILRADQEIPIIANFQKETVVPFLWIQEGYHEPSKSMVDNIRESNQTMADNIGGGIREPSKAMVDNIREPNKTMADNIGASIREPSKAKVDNIRTSTSSPNVTDVTSELSDALALASSSAGSQGRMTEESKLKEVIKLLLDIIKKLL